MNPAYVCVFHRGESLVIVSRWLPYLIRGSPRKIWYGQWCEWMSSRCLEMVKSSVVFCLEIAALLIALKSNVLGIQLLALVAMMTTCHASRCLPARAYKKKGLCALSTRCQSAYNKLCQVQTMLWRRSAYNNPITLTSWHYLTGYWLNVNSLHDTFIFGWFIIHSIVACANVSVLSNIKTTYATGSLHSQASPFFTKKILTSRDQLHS